MKILIIGGMHGNEPLGIRLVYAIQEQKLPDVDAVFANEEAIKRVCRYVEQDLNRSFPGKADSEVYELRRPTELLKLASGYDVVLDFHNTQCPDNDCGFVGETANAQLYAVAAQLGFKRVVVADYDCVNKYAPNCLSVEVSLTSNKMDVTWWLEQITNLAKQDVVGETMPLGVEKYRFVYRMTLADRDQHNLDKHQLRAFVPLPAKLAAVMGVKSPAYPIFIGDGYTPYNYGGLLQKINV